MLSAFQQPILSNPDVDFVEALATDAISATYNLRIQQKQPNLFLRAITLVTVQNLNYEVWLFRSRTNLGATLDTDQFIGMWQFGALVAGNPGWTVGSSTFFHNYIDGLMVPYWDQDFGNPAIAAECQNNAYLHVRLVNRSVTSKNAGETGALKLTFWTAVQGMQV